MKINWIEKTGDLLAETSGIIVHGCNAQGVMGAGVALGIRTQYPAAYAVYLDAHKNKALQLGSFTYVQINPDFYIVNGITQEFYGRDKNQVYVSYDAIRKVFQEIFVMASNTGLLIKMPRIGCGLANGNWETVKSTIEGIIPNGIGDSVSIEVYQL